MDYLNTVAGFGNAKPFSGKYPAITFGMQVGKPATELNLFPINGNGTVGREVVFCGNCGQIVAVEAQKPTYPGLFKLKETGRSVALINVHLVFTNRPEYPAQHIEKVDTDIGGHPARFGHISFPGIKIPFSTRSNVGKVYIVNFAGRSVGDTLFQCHDGRMEPQLQDVKYPFAAFLFDFFQAVQVPGVKNQGLLTDYMSLVAQSQPDVGIVQVVGRTNAHIIHFPGNGTPQLIQMPVEPFGFGKKIGLWEKRVNNTHAVERIEGGNQFVCRFFYGFHMPGGNVSGSADKRKLFWHGTVPLFLQRCKISS